MGPSRLLVDIWAPNVYTILLLGPLGVLVVMVLLVVVFVMVVVVLFHCLGIFTGIMVDEGYFRVRGFV